MLKHTPLQFLLRIKNQDVAFSLPVRWRTLQKVLELQQIRWWEEEDVYRVAWRNILDWVQAQMALIEIEMTKLEEVFLPYMVAKSGKTYFETLENRQFQLESGTSAQEGEVIHL